MLSYFYLFTNGEYVVSLGEVFKYIYLSIFILEVLFALIILPFILRLSGQLLAQTLKYRHTIKSTLESDEHIPYHEHYRIVFCLLLVIMIFNIFNLIKAFYLIKALFVYIVEPISLNIVLNMWLSFQDSIISFGLIAMLQIMYFYQEKKFKFGYSIFLIFLRFIFVFLILTGLIPLLISYYYNDNREVYLRLSLIAINLIDSTLRVFLIFRFAKEANDTIKKRLEDFFYNPEYRRIVGFQRVENLYRASSLFRLLSWCNFILAMLLFISPLLQAIIPFLKTNFNIYYSSVLCNEVICLLSCMLYAFFFLLIWKIFNRSSRVKYSGYNHFNMDITIQQSTDLVNPLTYTGAKLEKILLRYYAIAIVCITLVCIMFITPLLRIGWKSIVTLKKGDFYLLEQTNLFKAMGGCSTNKISFPQRSLFCSDVYFAKMDDSKPKSIDFTSNILSYTRNEKNVIGNLWLPDGSIIFEFKGINSANFSMVLLSKFPCPDIEKENFNVELTSVNFDCLTPEYDSSRQPDYSCLNESDCNTYQANVTNAGMVHFSINVSATSDFYKLHIMREIYNISQLSNVIHVSNYSGSILDPIYDIIVYQVDLDHPNINIPEISECNIQFTCTFPFYFALCGAIFIFLFVPTYLFISILFIHRY